MNTKREKLSTGKTPDLSFDAKIAGVIAVKASGLADDKKMLAGFLMEHTIQLDYLLKHLRLKMTEEQVEHFNNAAVTIGGLATVIAAEHDPLMGAVLDIIMAKYESEKSKS